MSGGQGRMSPGLALALDSVQRNPALQAERAELTGILLILSQIS